MIFKIQLEAKLQRAKFEGLAAVQGLLKTSLGDTSKPMHYKLFPTSKEGLNLILTGKIKNLHNIPINSRSSDSNFLDYYYLLIKQITNKDNSVDFLYS